MNAGRRAPFAVLVFAAIALGVFFRLYHLDFKVVWSDEVFTRLHVAGVTEAELVTHAGRFADIGSLQAYVTDGLNHSSNWSQTVKALVAEDPQHAPLFFLVERTWVGLLGSSLYTERLLPALLGIAALPCAFWLALELFRSKKTAWVCAAIMAVSPYFVLYSQENREYALWAIALFAMSGALLRALRLMTPAAWAAYAASIAIALNTDVLSAGVVLGHVLFLILSERDKIRRRPFLAAIAVSLGLIAFVPWAAVMMQRHAQIAYGLMSTDSGKNAPVATLRTFFGEFHLVAIDFNTAPHSSLGLAASGVALTAIVFAFVFFFKYATSREKVFILCVAIGSILPVLGPDLTSGGHRSAIARYLVPLFECIELALAFVIALAIKRDGRWVLAFALVVVVGVSSCVSSARAETWWSKYNERSIAIARVMNRSPRAILVSDNYVHFALSLAPYLKAKTRVALGSRCFLCHIPDRLDGPDRLGARIEPKSDIFLVGPSPALLRMVRGRSSLERSRITCIDIERNCTGAMELF